jgi:hypothetical protein
MNEFRKDVRRVIPPMLRPPMITLTVNGSVLNSESHCKLLKNLSAIDEKYGCSLHSSAAPMRLCNPIVRNVILRRRSLFSIVIRKK